MQTCILNTQRKQLSLFRVCILVIYPSTYTRRFVFQFDQPTELDMEIIKKHADNADDNKRLQVLWDEKGVGVAIS